MTEPTSTNQEWFSAPGETMLELAGDRGWRQAELAERLGYTAKHVSLLVNGKAPLTDETALRLARVLGGSPEFWLQREARYRARLAVRDERKQQMQWTAWLRELPVEDLRRHGAVHSVTGGGHDVERVGEALKFFAVGSPQAWRAHLNRLRDSCEGPRMSSSELAALALWLRLGEIEAAKRENRKYDGSRFRRALQEAQRLVGGRLERVADELQGLYAAAGADLVFISAPAGLQLKSVTRWISGRPLLLVGPQQGARESAWHSLFQASGHVLLHRRSRLYCEAAGAGSASGEAGEASHWADQFLAKAKRSRGAVAG